MPRAVLAFLIGVAVPFVPAVALFLAEQWPALVTPPPRYVALLAHQGPQAWSISTPVWKDALAATAACARADALVVGSSRTREIGAELLGVERVCNLYVNNMTAPVFFDLVARLPAADPGRRPVVYIGIDHFFFWREADDEIGLVTSRISTPLWQAVSVAGALGRFSPAHLKALLRAPAASAERPSRFEELHLLHYATGETYHPAYYADKAAGVVSTLDAHRLATAVQLHFDVPNRPLVDAHYLQRFREALALLGAKGYERRLFWNPLVSPYYHLARRVAPERFQAPLAAVAELVAEGAVERYAGEAGLDAARVGCTERDNLDAHHVDVDCLRAFLGSAFGLPAWTGAGRFSENLLERRRRQWLARHR